MDFVRLALVNLYKASPKQARQRKFFLRFFYYLFNNTNPIYKLSTAVKRTCRTKPNKAIIIPPGVFPNCRTLFQPSVPVQQRFAMVIGSYWNGCSPKCRLMNKLNKTVWDCKLARNATFINCCKIHHKILILAIHRQRKQQGQCHSFFGGLLFYSALILRK